MSVANPSMAFMGVRISWLMLERKLLFASFADFATSSASFKFSLSLRSLVRSENIITQLSLPLRTEW